jgi:hypothetical protein
LFIICKLRAFLNIFVSNNRFYLFASPKTAGLFSPNQRFLPFLALINWSSGLLGVPLRKIFAEAAGLLPKHESNKHQDESIHFIFRPTAARAFDGGCPKVWPPELRQPDRVP